jgi:hypothetical protein
VIFLNIALRVITLKSIPINQKKLLHVHQSPSISRESDNLTSVMKMLTPYDIFSGLSWCVVLIELFMIYGAYYLINCLIP